MDCIFCKIINKEIPSYTIYEDEIVKVFLDVNPNTNGHMLIVPKKHTIDITTIDDDTYLHIKKVSLEMKKLVEDKLEADGVTFAQNNGCCQDVKHYHMHLVPKYCNHDIKKLELEEVFNILTK